MQQSKQPKVKAPQKPKNERKTKPNQVGIRSRIRVLDELERSAPASYAYPRMPSVYMRSERPSKPGSSLRILGCDYIGPVGALTTENDTQYSVTPGLSSTFPRLSAIAAVFEKYSFHKVRFFVVGLAGSTTAGALSAAPSYTVTSQTLTGTEIRNREGQKTTRLWENNSADLLGSRAGKPWFTIGLTLDADYVFGTYFMAIDALAVAQTVGDLFVFYDVEFAEGKSAADPIGSTKSELVDRPTLRSQSVPACKSRC